MWQLEYNNPICNHRTKLYDQRLHVERVLSARGKTDTKSPIKPSFLIYKAKKVEMEEEQQDKINYENHNLLQKIIDAELKPSKYSIGNVRPAYCPALDFQRNLRFYKKEKEIEMNKSTLSLHCKIENVKSDYNSKKILKKTKANKKIMNRIKKNPYVLHPYIQFQSPRDFKHQLEQWAAYEFSFHRSNSTGNLIKGGSNRNAGVGVGNVSSRKKDRQ